MALKFVIGRAGSGKSRWCLEEIGKRLRKSPAGDPLILLVPEQATFQTEQALSAMPGLPGFIRAQVFSFRRLAWRAMQETGGTAGIPVNDLGKAMLLRKIIHTYDGTLSYYRNSAEKPGLVDGLNRFFKELRRGSISPEAFDRLVKDSNGMNDAGELNGFGEASERLKDPLAEKMGDLSHLYGEYARKLDEDFLDSETFLTVLAERIEGFPMLHQAEIWVDGFYGFTLQELNVLVQLAVQCRSVNLTLTLDRPYAAGEEPDEFHLFHSTARAMSKLRELALAAGAGEEEPVLLKPTRLPRFQCSPQLALLEQQFDGRGYRLTGSKPGPGESSQITLAAAVNRRAEVEGCAREIIRLARDEGIRWRDMAIRVGGWNDYGDLLEAVLPDFGIPYFMDRKRSVVHHPVVEFIRSALEVINHNWGYEAVFRCVKTDIPLPMDEEVQMEADGQTDMSDISQPRGTSRVQEEPESKSWRHAMDELENYVLAFGIQGYRWKEDRYWIYRESEEREDEDGITVKTTGSAEQFRRILACRSRVVSLFRGFEENMQRAETVHDKAVAVYRLLEECGAAEKLSRWHERELTDGFPEKARVHGQVWDQIIDMLDQMTEMMGEDRMTTESFAQVVETGLESICLGLVPPSLDQVIVGTFDRTRPTQVKQAFVLGANDGVIPARAEEDPILPDGEREWLKDKGLELHGTARRRMLDEQLHIYATFCSPSDRLWISYPLADEEGKALLPSEVVKRIRSLFPEVKEKEQLLLGEPTDEMSAEEQMEYITHADKALSFLYVRLKERQEGQPIPAVWWSVYNWFAEKPEWKERLLRLDRSLRYGNRVEPLRPATTSRLYGKQLRASVSRMERYVSCPFSQFASHGLRLRERSVYRLEAPDIGQLFHAALSRVVREFKEEQLDMGSMQPEFLLQRTSEVVDRITPRLAAEVLLSSSRNRYIARKLKDVVGRATLVLAEHSRGGQFYPVGVELGFGPGGELPPLTFRLDNGTAMDIVGRIDRVDRADGESGMLLRVIDYKSSDKALRLDDLYYGLSLQMLTYLDVVITYAQDWLGQQAKPAGVLYFHVHNPLISADNGISPEEAEAELRRRFKMKGLVLADPETVRLMDEEMGLRNGYSTVIPVAVKSDGSFYKSASVASLDQWELLRNYVRTVIRSIGTEIVGGCVDIIPYRRGNHSACAFCSYKPVCQFDPALEGNNYRPFAGKSRDDVWVAMEEISAGRSGWQLDGRNSRTSGSGKEENDDDGNHR